MKISFTTLSCPDWSWDKILDEAVRLGYDGIEVRGVEGEMFLPKAKPFLSENIDNTIAVLKQKGLEICCLDTSCSFHDPQKFDAAITEGKATIDLAQKLGVPYIRVFGNNIPDPSKKDETIERVAKGLETLARYADEKGVCVLIETHGDFSASDDLLEVLNRVYSPAIGVLWDINHPYKAFGEPIELTYERLGKYIKHTHIKDSKGMGKEAKLCLVGEGDLPIKQCIDLLKEHGYDGWLSLEWEKKWHPELEEPEVAIPAYIEYIKKILSDYTTT
jgi:sugar phosphate isomerase/epimerase